MAIKLISYDLINPGQKYQKLHDAIKGLAIAGNWWGCLESVWMIETSLNCAQIRDRLTPLLDHNDKLLVIAVGNDWSAWNLQGECSDWLSGRIR